jgi:hypothetical protein
MGLDTAHVLGSESEKEPYQKASIQPQEKPTHQASRKDSQAKKRKASTMTTTATTTTAPAA